MTDTAVSWEYLEGLQGVQLHRLYASPTSSLAIFRKLLDGLAKNFVMAMLYCPRPTLLSDFEMMVKVSSVKERLTALDQLRRYHIIKETTSRGGKAISLVPAFAKSLRQVLGAEEKATPSGK